MEVTCRAKLNTRSCSGIALILLIGMQAIGANTTNFEPMFAKSTLLVGKETLKPEEILGEFRIIHRAGTNSFSVHGSFVDALGSKEGKRWSTRSDDQLFLRWMAASTKIAYLVGYTTNRNEEVRPRLRRLDLENGQWLADLPVSAIITKEYDLKEVIDVLDTEYGLIVLAGAKKKSTAHDEDTIDGYSLAVFKESANKPLWSKQFPAGEPRKYTGGFLWGIPSPRYAGSKLKSLSMVGERLLVCPEAMQPIYCLNPETGSEIWKVDRLWEFQRGFIGPSVWSHYISRFGIESFGMSRKDESKERVVFDKRFVCALAGGPLAVNLGFEREGDSYSIFVATLKGPAGEWAGYLSDCVLYELGGEGKPISMMTIPQMVDGSEACVRDDGIIWRCQNDTFLKVCPSHQRLIVMMGGGGSDGISNLQWIRRVHYNQEQAWFASGKAGDPVAFGRKYAFCLPSGGYVLRKEESIYRFPIAAVDLSTGTDFLLILSVPFNGEFPIPDQNISRESLGAGIERNSTRSPHLLAITQIQARESDIELTLGMEEGVKVLRFSMTSDVGKTAAEGEMPDDAMEAARARVKLVEPKEFNATLQSSIHDGDVRYLRALLEAGADPKYTSANGWTALMVAAAYGKGEMVDELIKAGSDVNAADKNCGGQTILMWAARSGKESKHKVRTLLKAGADLSRSSEEGWNALMSAASAGDVEVLELLLKAGSVASVGAIDGTTPLMAAALSGKANVVAALISSGADLNATNNEGMTALMKAADSFDAGGAVETLLKAGADPDRVDKKGRTALRIAEHSNHSGAEQVIELLKPVTHRK
jgi:uncharacterized protein